MAIASLLGTWPGAAAPPLLLIVQERVRPGQFVVYDRTESEIRRACERWGCPNAYIALTSASSPPEVWWLTAWSSQEELDHAGALYAGNPALAARLAPLNARKRALTDEPTTILAKASGEASFTLAGARFVMVTFLGPGAPAAGAAYDLPDGRRIAIEPSAVRPARLRPDSMLLAIQPRWSLPPPAFASADPGFWTARRR
jgi:hypothetical protein